MELRGYLVSNDWGRYGGRSEAAKFYWNGRKRNKTEQESPYSELVISPYPEARCLFLEDGQVFGKFLDKYPEVLGEAKSLYNEKLPFEIKLLSVEKVRPMRFHPVKEDAEKMITEVPLIKCDEFYQDNRPKHKMVVALKSFELLSGLRTNEDIQSAFCGVPELSIIIPQDKQTDFITHPLETHLRDIMLYWLSADKYRMKLSLDMFFERMEKEEVESQLECNVGLMKRLQKQWPYNPGVYSPFFLNHVIMSRGDVIFLKSGLPYVYMSGDCLQVSSRSRNSVLLGLTDKDLHLYRSVNLLPLKSCSPDALFLQPIPIQENVNYYPTPAKEFSLATLQIEGSGTSVLPAITSCSVLVVVRGKAECFIRPSQYAKRILIKGSLIFLLPHQELSFTALQDFLLYSFVMELRGFMSSDEWGKTGKTSCVAELYSGERWSKNIVENQPYSEFWINPNPKHLEEYIQSCRAFQKLKERHPGALKLARTHLDFLIKIMSVGKVLPLKVNPPKDEAEELHKRLPMVYKDDTHRPKLVISLGYFEMLCGFKPTKEIKSILLVVPELSIIIPLDKQNDYISNPLTIHLRDIILYWLTATYDQMKVSLDIFFQRMATEDRNVQKIYNLDLMKRIHEQQPYNPGVYAPLFMNLVKLQENEATFIKSGLPHSYISGDCLQISSWSENEVLLALTQADHRIQPEGINSIDLKTYSLETLKLQSDIINENINSYRPPTRMFAVDKVQAEKGSICSLLAHNSSSLFVVVKGRASCYLRASLDSKRVLTTGSIVFLLPYQKFSFTVLRDILLFQVYTNTEYFC